jgi:hypothetical protein
VVVSIFLSAHVLPLFDHAAHKSGSLKRFREDSTCFASAKQ